MRCFVIIYHGTISTSVEKIISNGIDLKKGKPNVDFGQGFYTTPIKSFALNTARNKTMKTNTHKGYKYCYPSIISFDFDEERSSKLNILKFQRKDTNWAQFVVNNRNGFEYIKSIESKFHNLYGYFDIVDGEIADNKITRLAQELKLLKETVEKEDLNVCSYQYPTRQISFHTNSSLKCLTLKDVFIVPMDGGNLNEKF